MIIKKKQKLAAKNVMELILSGEVSVFEDVIISGDLDLRRISGITLKELWFGGTTIKGWFAFNGIIGGKLSFNKATIEKGICLHEATIKMINLDSAIVRGDIDFRGASIEEVDFTGSTIDGLISFIGTSIKQLDLSFEKGPPKILVSPEITEIIHLSAPTIPLVVK